MTRKYHYHKLQTDPWHWEEEPHNNHETLGRQTKKNNQLSLPHQDDCRSVCAHLCIQQTYTDFTYICAVVNEVIVNSGRITNWLMHCGTSRSDSLSKTFTCSNGSSVIDFELKKVLPPPPLENFADISYLKENFKPHLLRDVCTLCFGAFVSDSLLHMLL